MNRRYKLVVCEDIGGKQYEAEKNLTPLEIETASFQIFMHAYECLEYKMDEMKRRLSNSNSEGSDE